VISYVTLGSKDKARAATFYDEVLGMLDGKRVFELPKLIAWGSGSGAPMLMVIDPADGKQATVGNGVMVALGAKDKATVDAVYKKALDLGGKCEGPAGPRGDSFYAGYFRDLDGNKLCVCYTG
jgi:catechol 2,3-dioxygenase-like lactoylglutathione lyase family enzyme